MNKWTSGLAAIGLISLASVAQAEEKTTPILTALSSTQISGYVDVSAVWNPGTGTVGPVYGPGDVAKRDGFNLDSVLVTIEKPLEEGEWSAGYRVDLQYGPDAVFVTGDPTPGNSNVRQAYVALRAPVGNGLDLKVGRWDTLMDYEAADRYKNPNFTHSYSWTITPTEHTGILATYQALEFLQLNVGVADSTTTLTINARSPRETEKAYMAAVVLTAPESWGFLKGSTFTLYAMDGWGGGPAEPHRTDYYAGTTINTPIEGLSVGAAYNFIDDGAGKGTDTYTVAGYVMWKAAEKLGINFRGEYGHGALIPGLTPAAGVTPEIFAATATIQYDLWENVLSRLELRWDHDASGSPLRPWGKVGSAGTPGGRRNDFLVALNLVYKF